MTLDKLLENMVELWNTPGVQMYTGLLIGSYVGKFFIPKIMDNFDTEMRTMKDVVREASSEQYKKIMKPERIAFWLPHPADMVYVAMYQLKNMIGIGKEK